MMNIRRVTAVAEILAVVFIIISFLILDIVPLFSLDYHEPDYAKGMGLFMSLFSFLLLSLPLILLVISAWLNWLGNIDKYLSRLIKIEFAVVVLGIMSLLNRLISLDLLYGGLLSSVSVLFFFLGAIFFYYLPKVLLWAMLSTILLNLLFLCNRKFTKSIIILLFLIGSSALAVSYLPPPENINIPVDAPVEVKREIRNLYSLDSINRGRAAEQLGKMGYSAAPAIPFLIDKLDDYMQVANSVFASVSTVAGAALVEIGQPSVKPLINASKNARQGIREQVRYILRDINDKNAVEDFIEALKVEDRNVKRMVISVLGRFKDKRAVNSLKFLLQDKDKDIREEAATSLKKIEQ